MLRLLGGSLIGLSAVFLLGGCTTTDPETDAFYRRGWLWPRDLEKPYQGDLPSDDVSVKRKPAPPLSPGSLD